MNKFLWIALFSILLLADLAGVQQGYETWRYITKPLIIFILLSYFISQTFSKPFSLKRWVIFALVFSWAGDVLLMFEPQDPLFFILGLSAFLIAHIFYIIFFHIIRVRENVKGNVFLLLLVVIYYVILIMMLSPHLGDMKLPVKIYGVVISFMLMLALHTGFIENKKAALRIITGAILFIVSDSLLAINKFYFSFEYAGIAVMLTYGIAQLCIVEGAIHYIKDKKDE